MKTKYMKPELRVVNVAPQTILTLSGDNELATLLVLDLISDEDEY